MLQKNVHDYHGQLVSYRHRLLCPLERARLSKLAEISLEGVGQEESGATSQQRRFAYNLPYVVLNYPARPVGLTYQLLAENDY